MATATIVTIPDKYTARGLTFMPNGQQLGLALPAGDYDVGEECDLVYSDLGITKRGRAVQLVRMSNGEKWYVGPHVAQGLLQNYAAPAGRPHVLDAP